MVSPKRSTSRRTRSSICPTLVLIILPPWIQTGAQASSLALSSKGEPALPCHRNGCAPVSWLLLSLSCDRVRMFFNYWRIFGLRQSWADRNTVKENREQAQSSHQQPDGFRRPLPIGITRRDQGVLGQAIA